MTGSAGVRPAGAETPLFETAFCVVDLETTGGSPEAHRVTEVAAVRVRGGEVEGELETLVDPGRPIPTGITALTGITDHMVAGRPRLEAVLPSLTELARGCVIVAHNARFDIGFVNAALRRTERPELDNPVLCTVALARRVVGEEVRNVRLATLARHLRARHLPCHRALADARATVDVLHALIERAAGYGVTTLEDLLEMARAAGDPVFADRRHLAADLPTAAGVYRFVAAGGEVLYVGTAGNLRARVRRYFGGDRRRRVVDLVRQTERIDHEVHPTAVGAEVAEQRLIASLRPRFNRAGRRAATPVWARLTAESYPRLSLARRPRHDGVELGPLPGRRRASRVVEALEDASDVRRCTDRLSPTRPQAACALAEMGRCPAPCEHAVTPEGYADVVAPVAAALAGDVGQVARRLLARMERLARQGRFEDAATVRRRLSALADAVRRTRTRAWLEAPALLVASKAVGAEVEVVAVVAGRLVATARGPAAEARQVMASLHREATAACPPGGPTPAGEHTALRRWLTQPGVTAVVVEGTCAEPVAGGAALAAVHTRLRSAARPSAAPSPR